MSLLEMLREKGRKNKMCQKIWMPRERYVDGKGLKRHRCQETAMTSEKILSGEKSVSGLGLQSCQQEGFSRFRDDTRKPGQDKVHYETRTSRRKKCQGERVPRDHAVNNRDRQAVVLGSYKLFTFFLCFPWPPKTEKTRHQKRLSS